MSHEIDVYRQLMSAMNSNTPCVLATVVHAEQSTSATIGGKAVISREGILSGWIGGGCCQSVVKKLATKILENNQAMLIRVAPEKNFIADRHCFLSSCPSEGIVDLFLEPIANKPSMLLYGDSQAAASLRSYAEELGIHLHQPVKPYDSVIDVSQPLVAIVATMGQGDMAALQHAIRLNTAHILFIASHKKAMSLKQRLSDQGVAEAVLQRIIAPAGLEIRAESGAEIALSVMANAVSLQKAGAVEPTTCEGDVDELRGSINTKVPESTGRGSCCGSQ